MRWLPSLHDLRRVLRLTTSPGADNGLEIIAGSGVSPVVARPFSDAGETDVPLYIYALGSELVRVNGSVPIPPTVFTALGNVIVATGSGTYTVLAAGANDTVLTADSTQPTGLKYATAASLIANDSITYAKIQNVSATDRLLGRSTAGAGDIEEIVCTAAGRALIDDATASDQRTTLGLGTLATQSGTFSGTSSGTNTGDQTITLTGDVTGSGTGSFAATIANDSVTYAKMQNVSATDRLLGRDTAAAGDVEELTVGGGVEFTGSGGIQRSALTGDVTASAGSNATTIASAAVTLAKMANLAQDQFIGRTTASTGVPETATITAAARTVLDDTTVSAMVDTLGGAAATGTGGIARATSPNFGGIPTVGTSGGITRRMMSHWTRVLRSWLSDPATATTITNLGFVAAPTVLGTQSSSPGTKRDFDAFTTAASIGATGGIISAAFTYTRRAYEPTLVQAIRTQGSIADVRIWVGFFGADPTGSATAPANTAAFRYDTAADGTAFWRTVTSDATTPTVTATSVAIATGTEYVLRIEMSASAVEFFIDDVLVNTHTTNLPVSTTTVGLGATITALAASAKGIRWAWSQLWQN